MVWDRADSRPRPPIKFAYHQAAAAVGVAATAGWLLVQYERSLGSIGGAIVGGGGNG